MNLREIVGKIHKYKNLRFTNGRLFVAEGGWVKFNSKVLSVITVPNNKFTIKNDEINFIGSCEVVGIEVEDSPLLAQQGFHHFEVKAAEIVVNNQTEIKQEPYIPPDGLDTKTIVFDTNNMSQLAVRLGANVKLFKDKSASIINMTARSSTTINIGRLKQNYEYIILLDGDKNSGNGKISIGLDKNNLEEVHLNEKTGAFNLKVRSCEDQDGTLFLVRPSNATGSINIRRIVLVDDLLASCETVLALREGLGAKITAAQALPEDSSFFTTDIKAQASPILRLGGDKRFVIVIPSYKNEKWAEKNILSSLNQNYDNFRIIFTDDCSTDNTFNIVSAVTEKHTNKNKATLIKNTVRKGALENLYDMICSCDDDEIILTLDGDDWLSDPAVLYKLNKIYKNHNVWLTYGQFRNHPGKEIGISQQIPQAIIKSNNFRQYQWCSSHLRTFYTWLFKKIRKEDLMYEDKFAPTAWDMYLMFPQLEMAGQHAQFVSDVLYIYNLENPINDHKVDRKLQAKLDGVCRRKKKYLPIINSPIFIDNSKNKIDVGLMIIATGKYDSFIPKLIESADKLFLNNPNINVTYFIFTDKDGLVVNSARDSEIINVEHRPFPYASMDRFKHFVNNEKRFSKMDYLYYVDVDCKFVGDVSVEILSDLVGVRHCGYIKGGGTFETNKKSVFYVDHSKYKHYYGGGFSGGKTKNYLTLSKWCYDMIEKDLSNGIIPEWHDETAINRYFLDNEPSVSLSPSYHYPENSSFYIPKWKPYTFEPKILLLNKKHDDIRGA